MPDRTEQIVTLLASIDATLKRMAAAQQTPSVASDSDLDSKFGNPTVRFMPKRWTGQNYTGRLMSQCPPELLDLVAESLDWLAEKSERTGEVTTSGKPISVYKKLDASRARGWAKRLRNGWKPADDYADDPLLGGDPSTTDPFSGSDLPTDDDIPF